MPQKQPKQMHLQQATSPAAGPAALTKNHEEFSTQSPSSCSSCRFRASICGQHWVAAATVAAAVEVAAGQPGALCTHPTQFRPIRQNPEAVESSQAREALDRFSLRVQCSKVSLLVF